MGSRKASAGQRPVCELSAVRSFVRATIRISTTTWFSGKACPTGTTRTRPRRYNRHDRHGPKTLP